MNKAFKFGLILMIFGVVGMIFFGVVSGNGFESFYSDDEDYTYHEDTYNPDEYQHFKLDVSDKAITVLPSDDDDIHITYYTHELSPVTVILEEGGAYYQNQVIWYNYFLLNFNWFTSSDVYKMILYIPLEEVISLEAYTSNGKITMTGFDFDKLVLKSSNGSITLTDVTVDDDVSIVTSNGNFHFTNIVSTGDFQASTSNGDIDVTNLSANETELKTSNGVIEVSGITSDIILLQSSNGSIAVESVTTFTKTHLEMETSNGNYYINGSKVTQNTYHDDLTTVIDCYTSNGNISIVFPS